MRDPQEMFDIAKNNPLQSLVWLYVLFALWTCWFTVGRTEQAVVYTFGENTSTQGPGGPYFKAPWPFGKVEKIDALSVEEIPIGYAVAEDGTTVDLPEESETLTGDAKTIMVDATMQYSRADAPSWLFTFDDPERALYLLGKSALRGEVAARKFDEILTTERGAAKADAEAFLRDSFANLGLNVSLAALQIQDTQPPLRVKPSFDDVINAQEDKSTLINQANGYSNERTQEAAGRASRALSEATGYRDRLINEAQGEADRFNLVYAEYIKAPTLTMQRMQYEAIEAVLPNRSQLVDVTAGQTGSESVFKFLDVGAVTAARANTSNIKE